MQFKAKGKQQEHHASAAPKPRQNTHLPDHRTRSKQIVGGIEQVSNTSKPVGQRALVPGKNGQFKNVHCHNCQRLDCATALGNRGQ